MRHPPDEQRNWPRGINAMRRAKCISNSRIGFGLQRDPGGQNMQWCDNTVACQALVNRPRRYDHAIKLVALAARKTTRQAAQPTGWNHRCIMLQIFLEQRVIRRDHGQSTASCCFQPGIVRDERRLDMYQVESQLSGAIDGLMHRPPTHQTILRITRHRSCGHPADPRLDTRIAVIRRHQANLNPIRLK